MNKQPHVGLFVTCLVDAMRPSVGFASIQLLEQAGCIVHVPETQTCCGQPAYNSGDNADTIILAKQTISQFLDFDYVVVPSGSCGGMLRTHYPELFADDAEWGPKAHQLAAKTYELTSFLVDVCHWDNIDAAYHRIRHIRKLDAKRTTKATTNFCIGQGFELTIFYLM